MWYRERGFLSAAVGLTPEFADSGSSVVLAFTINEGPKVVVGRVTVTGNERLSEQQILEVLDLPAGRPLSPALLEAAQQRLYDMGAFRNVSVRREDLSTGETEAHVLVTVTEAPTISGGFGSGLEAESRARTTVNGIEDHIDLAPRGFSEITRRNLGGGIVRSGSSRASAFDRGRRRRIRKLTAAALAFRNIASRLPTANGAHFNRILTCFSAPRPNRWSVSRIRPCGAA